MGHRKSPSPSQGLALVGIFAAEWYEIESPLLVDHFGSLGALKRLGRRILLMVSFYSMLLPTEGMKQSIVSIRCNVRKILPKKTILMFLKTVFEIVSKLFCMLLNAFFLRSSHSRCDTCNLHLSYIRFASTTFNPVVIHTFHWDENA